MGQYWNGFGWMYYFFIEWIMFYYVNLSCGQTFLAHHISKIYLYGTFEDATYNWLFFLWLIKLNFLADLTPSILRYCWLLLMCIIFRWETIKMVAQFLSSYLVCTMVWHFFLFTIHFAEDCLLRLCSYNRMESFKTYNEGELISLKDS